jgi:hypothetical protein
MSMWLSTIDSPYANTGSLWVVHDESNVDVKKYQKKRQEFCNEHIRFHCFNKSGTCSHDEKKGCSSFAIAM